MLKKIEENEEINDNIIKQYYNNYINTHVKVSRIILDMSLIMKIYLSNRFSFSNSYLESLYCIINNIYYQPTCKICGKPVKFYNLAKGYSVYCSTKCSMNDELTISKLRNTFLQKYNADWYSKTTYFTNQIRTTCLTKYDTQHFTQTDEYKKLMIKNNNEKYGCDYGF